MLSSSRSPKASDLRKSSRKPLDSYSASPVAQQPAVDPVAAIPQPARQATAALPDDPGMPAAKFQAEQQLSARPSALDDDSDEADDLLEKDDDAAEVSANA